MNTGLQNVMQFYDTLALNNDVESAQQEGGPDDDKNNGVNVSISIEVEV